MATVLGFVGYIVSITAICIAAFYLLKVIDVVIDICMKWLVKAAKTGFVILWVSLPLILCCAGIYIVIHFVLKYW